MKKAVIVYASTHQGNTRRLVQAIAQARDVPLIDATQQHLADLKEYDLIGFASGIDFGTFYAPVLQFLKENLPEHKKVFFLYTCARTSPRFTGAIRQAALEKHAFILGEYGCKGYNTYGPWKWLGGINKGHPNQEELVGAVSFFRSLTTNN